MARIPIGIQLYTVRDQMAEKPAETIAAIARMGYEGVEGGPPKGMGNAEFKKLLADNGLKHVSGGTSFADLKDNLAKTLDSCAELGIDTLMIGWIKNEVDKRGGDWTKLVPELKDVCARAAEAGLRILYHNHAYEFEMKVGDRYALDYIYDNIPAEHLKAQIDTYWVKTGGEDPVAYVRKYAQRIPLLHIKDRAPKPQDETCPFAEIGHGVLDWDGIFAAAQGGAIEWYLVEQDRWTRPSLESAGMSIEYLRRRGMTKI